jgi:colanic acid biosynthesis glycosyl transferase WcaI
MPRALVLYHFFHPDDVVSSRHFSDMAAGLAEHGWQVIARPSNRSCRNESRKYMRSEAARQVCIRRIWRPCFRQTRPVGRLLNAIWMLTAWSLATLLMNPPELVLVGTDPILSVFVAIPWKLIRPRTKIVHWCFDLYPEAAIADGKFPGNGAVATILRRVLRAAYGRCDAIVDIGPCMRKLLATYGSAARVLTITPWALTEPAVELRPDTLERNAVFGHVKLALMYSGNFGRAHSFGEVLALARGVREQSIGFAFSVRGNRIHELQSSVSEEDRNIKFVPFADEQRLEARLSAADIHIVTLRHEWTGCVVPSKFFGALAAGRPVLFVGSQDSSVARWIKRHRIGWVLERSNQSETIAELRRLAEHPEEVAALFAHCHRVYQQHFSRSHLLDRLERELRSLIRAQGTVLDAAHAEEAA